MRSIRTLREAIAVTADNHPVLQHHTMTDPAELADRHVRVGVEIVSDFRSFINDNVRMQDGISPDADILANRYERADRRIGADHRSFMNMRQRMDTRFGFGAR